MVKYELVRIKLNYFKLVYQVTTLFIRRNKDGGQSRLLGFSGFSS